MSIDELKELLNAGKITPEQFAAMAKAIDPDYTEEEPTPETDPEPAPEQSIEKMIQSAVDRVRNQMGNENKKLRQQIETIKKNHLTEAQQAELDRQQREDELNEREKALHDEKNRWYAMKAIKAAGLDDGGENALALVDFVIGGTEEDINGRIKVFGDLMKKFVKAEVDKTFKQHGRTPEHGNGAGDKNPWAKETFNITQQMTLENTNPELAKQLKAAAGVK